MTAEFAAGLTGLAAGLSVMAGSIRLGIGSPTTPGPGLYPLLVGITLAATSALLSARARHGIEQVRRSSEATPLGLLAAMTLYAALFEPLGHVLATSAVAVAILKLNGVSWLRSIIVSTIVATTTHLVFSVLLNVELPSGLLERLL
jgi:putative tricarboxylic transport membrane protein